MVLRSAVHVVAHHYRSFFDVVLSATGFVTSSAPVERLDSEIDAWSAAPWRNSAVLDVFSTREARQVRAHVYPEG